MKKIIKIAVPVLVLAVIAAAAWFAYRYFAGDQEEYTFKTEKVTRGDLVSSISASGTVEPEELVSVGAQVTGKIMSFGTDVDGKTVDYGSRVKAGDVLARIDDEVYAAELREREAQVQQAKAEIAAANAEIAAANAAINQSQAALVRAEFDWNSADKLYQTKATSLSAHVAAKASYLSAKADLAAAEARLEQAKAKLEQAKAQLAIAEAALVKARRNMNYCVITSPVDGIIIDRRVSIGQTVVSSMNVSNIFLIAKDFKQMQVWVSVNEADIGNIKPGMPVEFTIDAFPRDVFEGTVKKVRLNATMSQNVVTYIVEVDTNNSSGKLIPYLTANVKFIRARRNNVLTVPNAALRFKPEARFIAPEYRGKELDKSSRYVWVAEGKFLRPVKVKTGLNAGVMVELLESDLKEGDEIVFGVAEKKEEDKGNEKGKSPFMPTPEKKGPRGGGSAANRARSEKSGQ